jgi:hypothetical protein
MTDAINLTPHALNIQREDGTFLIIQPTAPAARCEVTTKPAASPIPGVAAVVAQYGAVTDLPEPQPDTIYIVSMLVASRVPHRPDVFSPGELIRDEAGRVIGCIGLKSSYEPPSEVPTSQNSYEIVLHNIAPDDMYFVQVALAEAGVGDAGVDDCYLRHNAASSVFVAAADVELAVSIIKKLGYTIHQEQNAHN